MRPFLLALVLVACGGSAPDAPPDLGDAGQLGGPDAGPDAGVPDASAPDAGPQEATIAMRYDYKRAADACPYAIMSQGTCVVAQAVAVERVPSVLAAYPDCATSSEGAARTIDCSGMCAASPALSCSKGGFTYTYVRWTCPTPSGASGVACAWSAP